MTDSLDHFALAVADLDERIAFFTSHMGMALRRMGKENSTGNRIAMLADPNSGFKLELIESPDRSGLQHIARRVEDVQGVYDQMVAAGLKPLREPHRIGAAKAESALVEDPSGLKVQIIRYDPDSPDL
jgi:catechol 2,3-dioxygenase-like lactoylglutathione lyase family enzyme